METADLRATAERSKRECMAPVLGILPERAEQNKDFEVDDLRPWSEKNEVVVHGSVSAGNHDFSVPGDY